MWVKVKVQGEGSGRKRGRKYKVDKVNNKDNNVTFRLTTEIRLIKKKH
jgi:hypothetical protein